jgi:hypothetical protein
MSLLRLIKRNKPGGVAPATPVMRELVAKPQAAVDRAPPSADELRQMLFNAVAAGDEQQLYALCREHRQFIAEYAPLWMMVPDGLRANPAAAEWYTRGLQQLTRLCLAPPTAPRAEAPDFSPAC